MVKAFLSHSSKNKGFVGEVARRLGEASVEYDAMTFEAGAKTLDEITRGVEDSILFVFFISNESLNSEWVKRELLTAEMSILDGSKRFLPILIDNSISYDDPRIPEWMQLEYNIKYVSKVSYCTRLIIDALRVASWNLYSHFSVVGSTYVGRNEQISILEQRLGDIDRRKPLCCFVCGLPTIGRRSFFMHVLLKTRGVKYGYKPRVINLNYRNSIEDFIVHLYGLGSTSYSQENLNALGTMSMDDKIHFAANLLLELLTAKEALIIDDYNCIVSRKGELAVWFDEIIKIVGKSIGKLRVCVASRTNVRNRDIRYRDEYFSISIDELEFSERALLLETLLEEEDLELSKEECQSISNVLTGYPEQVKYAVAVVKECGYPYVEAHLNEIVDFSKERIENLLRDFEEKGNLRIQFLKLLSMAETLSLGLLEDVFGKEKGRGLGEIIEHFANNFVISYVDSSKEYIRLNDSIKDYIQRLDIKLESSYLENLNIHIRKAVENYALAESDPSDFIFSLKEALKKNEELPSGLLIPSHYANAMRELYNYDKKYDTVIRLAKRILQNEDSLDARIIAEIRWWQCMSMARKGHSEFLSEVQYFSGSDYNFLMGFYYRLKGFNVEAINQLEKALRERSNFNQAQRELVQAYINTERYDDASDYAEECYMREPTNPYFIQSYLSCLIHLDGNKNRSLIEQLLSELKERKGEKAAEMYLTSNAYYCAFVKQDINEALDYVQAAINKYPNNKYPYLAQLEIMEKFNIPLPQLQVAVDNIERNFEDKHDIYSRVQFICAKCVVLARSKSRYSALIYMQEKMKSSRFSSRVIEDIKRKVEIYGL